MQNIKQKLLSLYNKSGAELRFDEQSIRHDGDTAYFCDIDYENPDIAKWPAITHLDRIANLLAVYGSDEPNENVLPLLIFWLNKDFTNRNWWYNQIGVPMVLGGICLRLWDKLSDEMHKKALKVLDRGCAFCDEAILKWTGANLTWGMLDTLIWAALADNSDAARLVRDRFSQELVIVEGPYEGIKSDMSFYQHGPQFYAGGYGISFSNDTAKILYVLSGSEFEPSKEKYDLFENFMLDGQRYIVKFGYRDYLSIGREFAREGTFYSALNPALSAMVKTPNYKRKQEINDFWESQNDIEKDVFCDTEYFESSCYLSHNTPKLHIGVKGAKTTLVGAEWGNFENELAYNFTWGSVTCCFSKLGEHPDLSPVYDFNCVPGTSAIYRTDEQLKELAGGHWQGKKGNNDLCFGKTKDGIGVLTMKTEHDDIQGYVTFVTFEDGFVALGCDITAPPDTHTTVEQCLAFGQNETGISEEKEFCNGSFKYLSLDEKPILFEVADVTGNWKRNNLSYSEEDVCKRMFKATIEHGEDTNLSYAYAVLNKDSDGGIEKIDNRSEQQQVVFKNGRTATVKRLGEQTEIEII